jgi:hypothetical protein
MIKHHILKLNKVYAIAKLQGIKAFEIRFNDRDFKVGDIVSYTVPDSKTLNDCFDTRIFLIEFITDFEQKDGYIVYSEREVYLTDTYNFKDIDEIENKAPDKKYRTQSAFISGAKALLKTKKGK